MHKAPTHVPRHRKKGPGTVPPENIPPSSKSSKGKVVPSEAFASPSLSQDESDIEPLFVDSARDIDDLIRRMLPAFEGRETESNWTTRDANIATLRRLVRGNAPTSFTTHFINSIKSLLDDIFKVVNSLRTTLCTTACLLLQELVKTLGPKIDSWLDIMLNNLLKLCSSMKKMASQAANETVTVIIGNMSYTTRLLTHIVGAAADKNVQLRLYAAGWMREIILKQAHNPSSMEHGNGLGVLHQAMKKGLTDPNPAVREAMRKAFWVFAESYPQKAIETLAVLDPKSRSLLERDPANPLPRSSTVGDQASGVRPKTRNDNRTERPAVSSNRATGPSRPASASSGHTRATRPVNSSKSHTGSSGQAPSARPANPKRSSASPKGRPSPPWRPAGSGSPPASPGRPAVLAGHPLNPWRPPVSSRRHAHTSAHSAGKSTQSASSSRRPTGPPAPAKTSSLSSAPLRPGVRTKNVSRATRPKPATTRPSSKSPVSKPASAAPSTVSSPSASPKFNSRVPISPRMEAARQSNTTANVNVSPTSAPKRSDLSSPPSAVNGTSRPRIPISPRMAVTSRSAADDKNNRRSKPPPLDLSVISRSSGSPASAIGSPLELPSPLLWDIAVANESNPSKDVCYDTTESDNVANSVLYPGQNGLNDSTSNPSLPAAVSEHLADEDPFPAGDIDSSDPEHSRDASDHLYRSANVVNPSISSHSNGLNSSSSNMSLPAPVSGQTVEDDHLPTEVVDSAQTLDVAPGDRQGVCDHLKPSANVVNPSISSHSNGLNSSPDTSLPAPVSGQTVEEGHLPTEVVDLVSALDVLPVDTPTFPDSSGPNVSTSFSLPADAHAHSAEEGHSTQECADGHGAARGTPSVASTNANKNDDVNTSDSTASASVSTAPLRKVIERQLSSARLTFMNDIPHRRWMKIETAAHRRAVMPQSKDAEDARHLLAKGIAGMKNGSIDVLGYRHIQGLIQNHDKFFADEPLFYELLSTLFDELERPTVEKAEPLSRAFDIKTQVLMSIRFMLRFGQTYFKAYYPRAMTAILSARRNYDDKAHIVSGLVKTAFDIAELCDPEDVITAILYFIVADPSLVESEREKKGQDPDVKTMCDRSVLLGTQILGHLFFRFDAMNITPPQSLLERVGHFAGARLNDDQSAVRQAAIDLCLQIYGRVRNEQRFFKILGSPRETYKNLLTYYIARLE